MHNMHNKQPARDQHSREPFPPDHTPDPPQIMNPSSDHERNQKGTKEPAQKDPAKKEHAHIEKEHSKTDQ
jgi:hypothetical protein